MAREPLQELDEKKLAAIRRAFKSSGLTAAEVARRAEVNRSTVGRILDVDRRPMKTASVRFLVGLARALSIPAERLVDQTEMDLEIDEEFVKMAQQALRQELDLLRATVGRVHAASLTGVVGVHVHGSLPEKRIYEREFRLLPASRRTRRVRTS